MYAQQNSAPSASIVDSASEQTGNNALIYLVSPFIVKFDQSIEINFSVTRQKGSIHPPAAVKQEDSDQRSHVSAFL